MFGKSSHERKIFHRSAAEQALSGIFRLQAPVLLFIMETERTKEVSAVIYFDNAATTLHKPPQVLAAVCAAAASLGNAGRGVHAASLSAGRAVLAARETLAAFFGCPRPDHVIFTPNSTAALNIAVRGLLGPGDHVLSTDLEHNSVLRPLYALEKNGTAVDFLPADRLGNIDYDDFERLLRPDTRAVVCTHASNLTGTVLDAARIGAFCRKHGLLFILDASQTAGELPIDMEALGVSVLCFTGHKGLMGPPGTGGLCARPGVEIAPFLLGGTGVQSHLPAQPPQYPTRLEAGTLNSWGIAGLAAAVEFLRETGPAAVRAREDALMRRFYEGVRAMEGVTVYGDFSSPVHAPIVSLNLAGWDCGEAEDELMNRYGIAVRSGAHCAPRLHEALGTGKTGAVRFSFGYYNKESEVDEALSALREMTAL